MAGRWCSWAVALFLLGSVSLAGADDVFLDKIVVTPSRIEEPAGSSGGDTEIVTSSAMESSGANNVGDSLEYVNGLDVVGGGEFGSASQGINIRGAQTRHTAYLFEGIKLYDPSNTSAYYVPSDFLTSGLSRIEVVKTPLSSLYGSSPMGGVVNFIVKEPKGKPYVYLETEGGSFSTSRELLELGGKRESLSYLFNITRLDTAGFSKSRKKNNNTEKDPYQDTNITLNLTYTQDDDLKVGLVTKGLHSRTANDDDDDYDGVPEDDRDNVSWNNEFVGTMYAQKKLTDMLTYKIQGGVTSIFRRYHDDNDNQHANDNYVRSWYKGKTYQGLNSLQIAPCDFYKALVGFDYTKEVADSYRYDYSYAWAFGFESDFPKKTIDTKGFFIENIVTPVENLEVDFSWRLENQPIFKSHTVIKGKTSYKIPRINTDIYASYSEGFKAPSLFQLYDPARGNLGLKPEESKSWEAGLIQPLGDKLSVSASYFRTDFVNLIDFVYTNPLFWIGRYINAAKARSSGIESAMQFTPIEHLALKTGYTYLDARQDYVDDDFVTIFSQRQVRTPRHKAFLSAEWTGDKIGAAFELSYIGGRTDRIWKSVGFVSFDEFVVMKPYLLANMALDYKFSENRSVFLKVHNIFNRDYERIKGFQEEGASVYGGMKMKF